MKGYVCVSVRVSERVMGGRIKKGTINIVTLNFLLSLIHI